MTATGASSQISIDGYFTSDYDYYELIGTNVFSSSNSTLRGRVNVSNSAISGSEYDWGFTVPYRNSGGGALDTVTAWRDTDFRMNYNGQGTTVANSATLHMQIYAPLGGGYKMINYNSRGSDGVNNEIGTTYGGARWSGTTALTGVSLFANAGNLTGTFKLYGVK